MAWRDWIECTAYRCETVIGALLHALRGHADRDANTPLMLEELEDRVLLSASPLPVDVVEQPDVPVQNPDNHASTPAEAADVSILVDATELSPLVEPSAENVTRYDEGDGEYDEYDEYDNAALATSDASDRGPSPLDTDSLATTTSRFSSDSSGTPTVLNELVAERREIVFVNADVADSDRLVVDLRQKSDESTQFDVVLLDGRSNGVREITAALETRNQYEYDTVHILSHGSSAGLRIGGTWLTADRFSVFAAEISEWRGAMTADADLLIYGCDLASSDEGRALLEALSAACDCDVAASVDDTGQFDRGGDWDLEYEIGTVESHVAPSQLAQSEFRGLLATFTVTNTSDTGAGSLHQAILDANAAPGADIIDFAIGTGQQTIALVTELPSIDEDVTIDGRTQGGFSGTPLIEVDGQGVVPTVNAGLLIDADNVTIHSLSIVGWNDDGIQIQAGRSGNFILGNYIGLRTDGTTILANADDGIDLNGDSNTIGGTAAGERNVISGNSSDGIELEQTDANNNTIIGNYIGTDAGGTVAKPNASGLRFIDGAHTNTIGGTSATERNVISGNSVHGFDIEDPGTDSNAILGNFIGVNKDGDTALANAGEGINIDDGAQSNIIGGTAAGSGNVISGNVGSGVLIDTVGSDSNQVLGNFIGTDLGGTLDLGNQGSGVRVENDADDNIIGSIAAGGGNTIAFNDQDGVRILDTNNDGNSIRGNSIFSNDQQGIDLATNGITANDVNDGDSGSNEEQNFPVLATASSNGGNTTITGTLNSLSGTSFDIDFYSSPSGDEGQVYLGSDSVTTVGNDGTINTTLIGVSVTAGHVVTATATDPSSNTSEFSAPVTATTGDAVSGIVYSDEGSTALGNQTVRIAVNGVDFATTAESNATTGAYSIAGLTLSGGDVLTVYLEDESADAVTVTVSDGADLTGIDLYQDYLITRQDNGGALTNANLATAEVGSETDISNIYSTSAGNLLMQGNTELLIRTGNTFTPGGDVTAFDIDIDGTFDAAANAVNLDGDWDNNSGVATTSGTVTFTGSGAQSLITGGTGTGNDFQTLVVNKTGGTLTQTTDHLDVDGTLTVSAGTFAQSAGLTITAAAYSQGGGSFAGNNSGIDLGSFTLSAGTFTATSGNMTVDGGWTHTAGGTFTHNSGTVTFDGGAASIDVDANETFNDLTVAKTTANALTIASNDNLIAVGDLTLTDGLVNATGTASLRAEGNVVVGAAWDGGDAVLWFQGTAANQTFDLTGAVDKYDGDISLNKTAGQVDLLSDLTMDVAFQDITLLDGTLDLNGFNINGGPTIQVQGDSNFQLQGGESFSAPTFSNGTTATYDGSGTETIADLSYANLTINGTGTFSLGTAESVVGDLNVVTGTFNLASSELAVGDDLNVAVGGTLLAGGNNINLTGNWSNLGTFTHQNGSVVLIGSAQQIDGSTTFYDLSKTIVSADTLLFETGSTTTIANGGTITLNGASGQLLTLDPDAAGDWLLDVDAGATQNISYVDASQSDASGGAQIDADDGTNVDGTGNTNWLFAPATTISGTVYSDEGTTALVNQTVRVAINGVDFATTAESHATLGTYSITGLTLSAADVITVYLEDETADAVTVTVSDGNSATIDLYQDFLIARQDNGGSLTTANLGSAEVTGENDISNIYDVSGSVLTVQDNKSLLIPTGYQFDTGGLLDVFHLSIDGTLDASTNGINVAGDIDNDGVFVTGGTVTFDGAGSQTLFSGGTGPSNDFTIATVAKSGGSLTFSTEDVEIGTLNLVSGTLVQDAGVAVSAAVFLQTGGIFTGGDAGFDVNGTFTQNTGTFTASTGTTSILDDFTIAGGTFDANGGTLVFDAAAPALIDVNSTVSLQDLTFAASTGQTVSLAANDTLVVLGNLTFQDGLYDGASGASVEARGDVVVGSGWDGGDGLLLFAGTASQTFDLTGGTSNFDGDLRVNKSGGQVELLSIISLNGIGQDFRVEEGTFDLNGNNLSASVLPVIEDGGNFQLEGAETFSSPTPESGATVTYDGSGVYVIKNMTYHHLVIDGTGSFSLGGGESVAGDFTVLNGSFDLGNHLLSVINDFNNAGVLSTSGGDIQFGGDWDNQGTFNHDSSIVTLNGGDQQINGSATFFDLTKTVAAAATLTLESGSTQAIANGGTLTLNGASGQLLTLAPTAASDWLLNVDAGATQSISYVSVSDSDASAGAQIVANDGTNVDGTGNTNWLFAATQSISGTVYSDEGATALGNQTVRVAVNGVDFATTAESNATTGAYAISGLSLSGGDVLTVYLEDETADAVTVTVSDGNSLGSVDLYQDYLITRQDNGGSLTNTNLNTALVVGEADIGNVYALFTGNLVMGTASELLIPSGHTFAPGTNVTAHNIDIEGTFDATGSQVFINGNWDNSSGTATTDQTVTFNGSGSQAIVTGGVGGGQDFENLTINNSGTVTVQVDDLLVNQTLTLTAGALTQDTGVSITSDDYTQSNGTFTGGNATIDVINDLGLAAGTFISTGGTLRVGGNWTDTGTANFVHNGGAVAFYGNTAQLVDVNVTDSFNDLRINKTGGSALTIGTNDTLATSGLMEFNDGVFNNTTGALIQAFGDVDVSSTWDGGDGYLLFSGLATQTFDTTGTFEGDVYVNKSGGSVELLTTFNANALGQEIHIEEGTFDLNGNNLTASTAPDVEAGGNLQLLGSETVTTPTLQSGSTVTYDSSGAVSVKDFTYAGLNIDGTGTFTLTTTESLAGDLTVLNGTFDLDGNTLSTTGDFTNGVSGTVTTGGASTQVAGDWNNLGTFTHGNGSVVLNGTGQSVFGSTTFYDLTKTVAAADTLTFASGATQDIANGGSLTLNGASGQLLTLVPSAAGDWLLDVDVGATQSVSFVNVSNSDASPGAQILANDATNISGPGNTNWLFGQNTITVDITADENDGDTSSIANLLATPGGTGISLREAIIAANNTANGGSPDEIHFNIAGGGPHVISVGSSLPTITEAVVIDGSSEPDFSGTPIVELDGSLAGVGADGLTLAAGSDGSTVLGLVINRFTSIGIAIASDNNVVAGNYIGIDVTGLLDLGNGTDGIQIAGGASGNIIGGAVASERNVISGNTLRGVLISGAGTSANELQGNYIGLGSDGSTALGNGTHGVMVTAGATANIIGTNLDGINDSTEGNVLSANTNGGILISSLTTDGNIVRGNLIGTDAGGTLDRGNASNGIGLYEGVSGNIIGGSNDPNATNVIGFSGQSGIFISGPTNAPHDNTVQGNAIGTDAAGTTDLGNVEGGIAISQGAYDNLIGGVSNGLENLIANNGESGVFLTATAGTGNALLRNSIYDNTTIGIDIERDGVTANDSEDADSGANDLLNFPVLTNVVQSGADLDIDFQVDLPAGNYRIEFFDNSGGLDSSGFGEGETFVGFASITALGSAGSEPFSTTLTGVTASNVANITVAATEDLGGGNYGSTSEFGPQFAGVGVLTVDTTSDTADGDTSSIAALLGNRGADGQISLREAMLAANNTANAGTPDQIEFGVAGGGVQTIAPLTALPIISDAVVIDGLTQTGASAGTLISGTQHTLLIEIDGSSVAGSPIAGLEVQADDSTIRGLIVNNWTSQPTTDGILVSSADNVTIESNYVGTNAGGTTSAANQDAGVILNNSTNSTVHNNLLSGNSGAGLAIRNAASSGNVATGNIIGLDAAGAASLGNNNGLNISVGANGNTIGGVNASDRNVISGNAANGIRLLDAGTDNNTILGNYIGVDRTGTTARGNSQDGVTMASGPASNTIGGTAVGAGNLIANNSRNGISLAGSAGTGNAILGNQLYSNGATALDLVGGTEDGFGVTANDVSDGDTGPNNLPNYPVLTAATTTGSSVTIQGTLNSAPSTTYRIEFFASTTADASGHGEGERYLGFVSVTTDGTGNVTVSQTIAATVASGESITATATDPAGNTSEFASNAVAGYAPVLDLDADNSAGAGGADFAATFVEDAGPIAISDNDASLTDVDSLTLNSMLVTITNLQDGLAESLTADTSGTVITASFAGGVLTLSGSETVAGYQQVLRTVSYNNSSQDPGTVPRSITFVASDGPNTSAVATATVTITSVNDAPVVVNESYVTDAGMTISESAPGVLANDSDVDGTLSASIVSGPSDGVLALGADGSFTYTPNIGFVGSDSFVYQASDGVGGATTGTVSLSVRSIGGPTNPDDGSNDPPGMGDSDDTWDPILGDPTFDNELGGDAGEGDADQGISIIPDESEDEIVGTDNDALIGEPPIRRRRKFTAGADSDSSSLQDALLEVILGMSPTSDAPPRQLLVDEVGDPSRGTDQSVIDQFLDGRLDISALRQFEFSVEQGSLWTRFDAVRSNAEESLVGATRISVGSGVVMTVSAGYLMWAVRSGYLLVGLASSAPAWTQFDPLPILNSTANIPASGRENGESLDEIASGI